MNPSASPTRTVAYLICADCRLGVLLGDTTASPDLTITSIKTRGYDAFDQRPRLPEPADAAWRLINEHCGHTLRILAECWYAFDTYWATPFAGVYPFMPNRRPAVRVTDITWEAYTDGWPHDPAIPDYAGATPTPRRHTPTTDGETTGALLVCLPCRIALDLGETTVLPDGTNTTFTRGDLDTHHDHDATAALGRLFVDHAGHDLTVLLTNSTVHDDYMMAGAWLLTVQRDTHYVEHRGDLTWHQYITGWPDNPAHPRHLGITPVARRDCTDGGRTHHNCVHQPPPAGLDLEDAKIPVPYPDLQ